jgi:hypothetical protein
MRRSRDGGVGRTDVRSVAGRKSKASESANGNIAVASRLGEFNEWLFARDDQSVLDGRWRARPTTISSTTGKLAHHPVTHAPSVSSLPCVASCTHVLVIQPPPPPERVVPTPRPRRATRAAGCDRAGAARRAEREGAPRCARRATGRAASVPARRNDLRGLRGSIAALLAGAELPRDRRRAPAERGGTRSPRRSRSPCRSHRTPARPAAAELNSSHPGNRARP